MDSPLNSIIYISLPENMEKSIGDFHIDPGILLPVETLSQSGPFDPSELTWEMILSGMLKVIGYDSENEHLDYYRNFLLSVKPDIVTELSKTGIIKAEQKDFTLAEEIFLILSKIVPDDVNIILNLAFVFEQHAEIYNRLGKISLAEDYQEKVFYQYKKALSLAPDSPQVLYNSGQYYLRRNNSKKAYACLSAYLPSASSKKEKRELEEILENLKNRQDLDTIFSEAFDYIRIGRESEGIQKINTFIENQPDVWNAWFLLGWAQRRLGKYSDARESFLKALSLTSPQTDILNELSICAMELNNFAESREYLEKALQLEPDNIKIISNLGILSIKENNPALAKTFFNTVLVYSPSDPIAKHYLDFIEKM